MDLEFIHKKLLGKEPELCVAEVFLLQYNFEPILHYTGKIGHHKIDFFFISGKLRGIGMEVESTLKQKMIELVKIRAVEGIQNTGL